MNNPHDYNTGGKILPPVDHLIRPKDSGYGIFHSREKSRGRRGYSFSSSVFHISEMVGEDEGNGSAD